MTIFWAVILGIVQGVAEFLPISSSGHLVIFQSIIPNFAQPGALFDVVLHFGTMCAVLFYFRKTLFDYIRKYWKFFIVGTIPAGLVGFFFQSQLEGFFGNIRLVGFALLITAIFNFVADRIVTKDNKLNSKNTFVIGMFQALAIIPGISRSGSTIFAGLVSGVGKKKVAEFSFLLSVPAVFGANVLEFYSTGFAGISHPLYYFAGFAAAFISGLVAIKVVLKALFVSRFKLFGFYCLILGISILWFSLL